MGRYIIRLIRKGQEPFYLEWSTVADAPATYGMNLSQFHEHYRQEYGESGMRDLPARMERVEKQGSSSMEGMSAFDIIRFNRAGPNECGLREWEIYRAYCLRQPVRGGWLAE